MRTDSNVGVSLPHIFKGKKLTIQLGCAVSEEARAVGLKRQCSNSI